MQTSFISKIPNKMHLNNNTLIEYFVNQYFNFLYEFHFKLFFTFQLFRPHGDLVLSVVSLWASHNLDIPGVKFDSNLTFEDHLLGIVSRVSHRIGILRMVKRIFVDTFVLLLCYFAYSVLPILEYCSPVWKSAAEYHLQPLEREVYPVARLCPDQMFLSLCHRRRVAGLSCCKWSIRTTYPSCGVSSSIGVWSVKV